MKHILTLCLITMVVAGMALAQPFGDKAIHNVYQTKLTFPGPDSLKPYLDDQGVRQVWVTKDMDKDGKPEILATDYSNRGRVHVYEMTSPGVLELVWSSPRRQPRGGGSTPRWARDGDLDGDGNREIIFGWAFTTTSDSTVQVFEWTGADNDYGTEMAFELPSWQFRQQGVGQFRMSRELGEVYDFDGDGKDELITANRDNKVYILGVLGEFPGFASWQLEGGDPSVHPDNRFSGGSWWHSMPADIDGDGSKEIVNHYYNYWGYWSIDVLGPDSYRYPTPSIDSLTNPAAKHDYYHEYTLDWGEDLTSYFGITPVDVDGDGKQEIAGMVFTGGASDYEYDLILHSLTRQDTGVYIWRDNSQMATIAKDLWTLVGKTAGTTIPVRAYDFNGNGRDELVVGGAAEYSIILVEHDGVGPVLDPASYTATLGYQGEKSIFYEVTYSDSLGIAFDTLRAESPFVTMLFVGCDLDNNGKKEIVIPYQSIADSVLYTYRSWDTTAFPKGWRTDSTKKVVNVNATNFTVAEYVGPTGFQDKPFIVVTPDDYRLEQNYPNPFNPSTQIRFTLPVSKRISLIVYDMVGREVKRVIDGEDFEKGTHTAVWDGTDAGGVPVSSGNYIYTLKFGTFSKSAKMTLLK